MYLQIVKHHVALNTYIFSYLASQTTPKRNAAQMSGLSLWMLVNYINSSYLRCYYKSNRKWLIVWTWYKCLYYLVEQTKRYACCRTNRTRVVEQTVHVLSNKRYACCRTSSTRVVEQTVCMLSNKQCACCRTNSTRVVEQTVRVFGLIISPLRVESTESAGKT